MEYREYDVSETVRSVVRALQPHEANDEEGDHKP